MSPQHLIAPIAALLLSSCALEASQPAAPALAAQERAQPLVIAGPGVTPALPAGRAERVDTKRPDVVPHHTIAPLDLAAVGAAEKLPSTWLNAAQQAKINASPAPVLMPMDEALVKGAQLNAGPRWGAWHVQADGVTLRLHATDMSVELPALELDEAGEALTKRPYLLSRNHQIITITFNRFGAGYALDVECAQPTTDTRCTEDGFALELFSKLVVAPRRGV
jgi:hypothetical protein